MTQSADPAVVESSKVILGNILYHSEYRDMFVTLLRNYKQPLQTHCVLTRCYIDDTCIHTFNG